MTKEISTIIVKADYSNTPLSHKKFVTQKIYQNSSFRSCDMNNVYFIGSKFIECNFDDADMSNSTLIDCEFIDCTFKNTSLSFSTWNGTVFKSPKRLKNTFKNASLSNAVFSSSKFGNCYFENIDFSETSLRNAIFENVVFKEYSFDKVPFENVTFMNCSFDVLDLTYGTVKGLIVKSCKIKYFTTIAEKIFSIIGFSEILMNSEFKILHSASDGAVEVFTDITSIYNILSSGVEHLINNGDFYEYINSIVSMRNIKTNTQFDCNHDAEHNKEKVYCLEDSIDFFVKKASDSGTTVTLNSINKAVDVFHNYDLMSNSIYMRLISLIKSPLITSSHPQVFAELFTKLSQYQNRKDDNYICMVFIYNSNKNINYIDSAILCEFINDFLICINVEDYAIVSRTHGSIHDKVIISKNSFKKSLKELCILSILLGTNITISYDKESGINFNLQYKLEDYFDKISTAIPLVEEIFQKISKADESLIPDDNISDDDVIFIDKNLKDKITIKEMWIKDKIQINIRKANVKEIPNFTSADAILQNQAKQLELPEI